MSSSNAVLPKGACFGTSENCQDENYEAIFEALPCYFDTQDLRQFVCSLTAAERADLLDDILNDPYDHLADLTEEDFDDYMETFNEHVLNVQEALEESGPCSYSELFNVNLWGLWYEYYN